MPESTPVNTADAGLELRTHFVRSRNALFVKADFSTLYVDYYLHLSDHGIHYSAEQDALFKRALSGFVLHCASRPWNELIAWTIHFESLRCNLFLAGDNEDGTIIGRLFDEDVKEMNGNFFYADIVRGTEPKHRSVAQFDSEDPLVAIETFYRESEQRGVRCFQLEEETFALVAEHPDCDLAWLRALTSEQVVALEKTEALSLIERRIYRWHCGCNQTRMLQVLAPAYRLNPDEVFGGVDAIEMRCPRCGARHEITRQEIDAYLDRARGTHEPES
jgi:molecular chaperone Hsp33